MKCSENKRINMLVKYFSRIYLDNELSHISAKGLILRDLNVIDNFLSMILTIY
jgi:hypothetical protein